MIQQNPEKLEFIPTEDKEILSPYPLLFIPNKKLTFILNRNVEDQAGNKQRLNAKLVKPALNPRVLTGWEGNERKGFLIFRPNILSRPGGRGMRGNGGI